MTEPDLDAALAVVPELVRRASDLSIRVSELEGEKADALREVARLGVQLDEARAEVAHLIKAQNDTAAALDEARANCEHCGDMRSQLSAAETERDEAKRVIRNAHQAIRTQTTAAAVALAMFDNRDNGEPSLLDELTDARNEVESLRSQLAEHQALFDLQWTRQREADALWQAEDPTGRRAGVWPDLGRLLEWLIARGDTARNEVESLRADLDKVARQRDSLARRCASRYEEITGLRSALDEANGMAAKAKGRVEQLTKDVACAAKRCVGCYHCQGQYYVDGRDVADAEADLAAALTVVHAADAYRDLLPPDGPMPADARGKNIETAFLRAVDGWRSAKREGTGG